MREILFRGKRADNGEWVYGYYTKHTSGKIFIRCIGKDCTQSYEVIPSSVGEYTGLEANGKQVFEGDILNYFGILYIVSWNDSLLTYIVTSVDEKKEYLFFLYKANMDCVYIVGNIHDNPELLEVKL